MAQRSPRFLSPLTRNILFINLITLMIPVLGFLYLVDYRRELIRTEVQSLTQETQTFADALAEGSITSIQGGFRYFDMRNALQILRRVSRRSHTRAILFLSDGTLLADTRFMHNGVIIKDMMPDSDMMHQFSHLSDRFHAGLNYMEDLIRFEKYREPADIHIRAFPHAIQALAGQTRAKVWAGDSAKELVMSVASPIQPLHRVYGVLVVTRRSDTVEATIRELRHNILTAFMISILFTITMSLLLGRQIAQPLSRLAKAACLIDSPHRPLNELTIPILNKPNDEIGILSRALSQMTESLKARITAIDGFAADVAHEIRNPLAGISSALDTHKVIKSEEKREELLEMARAELRRMDVMIDEILESSRLDAAIHEEDREALDVVQWMAQFVHSFHDLHHDQELIADMPSKRLWIAFKETRLTQIMQNLLSNAYDFQPEGKPIQLSIVQQNDQVRITVMDQGPGIPEQALERIFSRFYSDRPHQKQTFHTGLGLSIVQQIVEGYNGTIIAKNRPLPQTGAIFEITLPLVVSPDSKSEK